MEKQRLKKTHKDVANQKKEKDKQAPAKRSKPKSTGSSMLIKVLILLYKVSNKEGFTAVVKLSRK